MTASIVQQRQEPLCASYVSDAKAAWIEDGAQSLYSKGHDPFHGAVRVGGHAPVRFGIHRALGGDHDLPNPGDLLCVSLAACLDATLRLIADRLGVKLRDLEVDVKAEADVRGALRLDPATPTGFQRMTCRVRIVPENAANDSALGALLAAAERSCVVLNTLRAGVDVKAEISAGAGATA